MGEIQVWYRGKWVYWQQERRASAAAAQTQFHWRGWGFPGSSFSASSGEAHRWLQSAFASGGSRSGPERIDAGLQKQYWCLKAQSRHNMIVFWFISRSVGFPEFTVRVCKYLYQSWTRWNIRKICWSIVSAEMHSSDWGMHLNNHTHAGTSSTRQYWANYPLKWCSKQGNHSLKEGRMFTTLDCSPNYLCHSGACRKELQRGVGGGCPGTGSWREGVGGSGHRNSSAAWECEE